MAEDLEWARDVLLSGYELAYLPEARVEHAHERSARYELARTYLCHRRLFELFGLRTIPSAAHLIPAVATSLRDHVRCLAADRRLPGARELWRALALACVLPAGQYLGGLSAARGWRPWRLGRV
jgi:GT2 family glycosyltransferase